MKVAQVTTADGLPLTYYVAGAGPECVVILNAPGMSIRFWTHVIAQLQQSYTVVGMEYRGFPASTRELTAAELAFDHYADDLRRVLDDAGVGRAHVVTWCLGAKVGWDYWRRYPDAVASLLGAGMAFGAGGEERVTPFSVAMQGIRQRIERDPRSIQSMITLMKRIGLVPDAAFLATVLKEEADGAALSLMDLLEGESSMSTLAFYLLDNPVGLRNYLNMYEEFRRARIADCFDDVRVPVTVVSGTRDAITALTPERRRVLDRMPDVQYVMVEDASHFLPVEFPNKLARMIDAHVQRTSAPAR